MQLCPAVPMLRLPCDLRQTFLRIAQSLPPRAHFVFEFVPAPRRRVVAVRGRRHFRRRVEQSIRWDPRRRLVSVAMTVRSVRSGLHPMPFHEHSYSLPEMTRALLGAGFIIRGVHDAHTLGRAEPHSTRLIVVAQRG